MAAFLVPLQPGACVIPLEKAILLIGRQADCDVSLTASRKISRKHCCIAIVNDAVVIRDLGSTNGVTINGTRVEQEGRLRLGDEISIGDVRFRLQKDVQISHETPDQIPQQADPSPSGLPARNAARQHPQPPPPSLDFPVAIEDDSNLNFSVESTVNRSRPKSASNATESDSGPLVPFLSSSDSHDVLPMPSDSN